MRTAQGVSETRVNALLARVARAVPAALTSRLGDEFQPCCRLQRLGIEAADFRHAADVERDQQPVAGDAGRHNARALRQRRGDINGLHASIAAEKLVADGEQHRAETDSRGQARNQHHPAHALNQGCLLRRRFWRIRFSHDE